MNETKYVNINTENKLNLHQFSFGFNNYILIPASHPLFFKNYDSNKSTVYTANVWLLKQRHHVPRDDKINFEHPSITKLMGCISKAKE